MELEPSIFYLLIQSQGKEFQLLYIILYLNLTPKPFKDPIQNNIISLPHITQHCFLFNAFLTAIAFVSLQH